MSAYRQYRTAGPWFVGHAVKNGQLAIIGDVDSVVALLPDESLGCTLNEPNARLIAAAPELLAALYAVTDAAEYMEFDPDSRFGEAVQRVSAAIAKATGEQA